MQKIALSERVVYLMSSCIERNLRSMAHRKNQILREHAKGASYRGLREVHTQSVEKVWNRTFRRPRSVAKR
jgi:hypothetical protein